VFANVKIFAQIYKEAISNFGDELIVNYIPSYDYQNSLPIIYNIN